MPEIMSHPFFFRTYNTTFPILPIVEAPRLNDLAQPLDMNVGIDGEILTNLVALCQGQSQAEIVNSLTCAR